MGYKTCKECAHYSACKSMAEAAGIPIPNDDHALDASRCDTFEAKAVRCMNCCFSQYFEESGTRKCRAQNGLYRTVNDGDFCSYGERRADNE